MVHDLFGLNFNVHGLAAGASQGLVNHDAAVGHAVALSLLACGVDSERSGNRITAKN